MMSEIVWDELFRTIVPVILLNLDLKRRFIIFYVFVAGSG